MLITRSRCPNTDDGLKADRGIWYVRRWADIYLRDALARLAPHLKGYNLTIEDMYTLQQMCAYEASLPLQYRLHVLTFRVDLTNQDRCHWIFQILWAFHRNRVGGV